MTALSRSQATPDLEAAWRKFKAARSHVLGSWVEAERAMALANKKSGPSGPAGERLMAAEAALQSVIVDFAAGETGQDDPIPLALALLRKAEAELFVEPPDLRRMESGDRRRSQRRGTGDRRA